MILHIFSSLFGLYRDVGSTEHSNANVQAEVFRSFSTAEENFTADLEHSKTFEIILPNLIYKSKKRNLK
jgi:hypothetical protein